MDEEELKKLHGELNKSILVVQQLKECSENVTKTCDEILMIMTNPLLTIMFADKLKDLLAKIQLNIAIFNNLCDAVYPDNGKENENGRQC